MAVIPRMARLVAAIATITVGAGCSSDDPRAGFADVTTTTIAPLAIPGAPSEWRAHPTDWVVAGRDYGNSRASTTSDLDLSNVSELRVRWEAPVSGGLSTVPLIVGDRVYVQDGSGTVYAFARSNGREVWRSKAYGANIGPYGVAVANGVVFALAGSRGVVALDAKTGAQRWERELATTPTMGIDIQPLAFDDLVLVSTVPVSMDGIYTAGDRGVLYALDAANGATRWSFDTVEGDLWGHPEINSGGGAWYPPAIDAEQRIVYWGTANPAPFPGTAEYPNGTSRPGPNLYTDSVLAIDLDDGKLLWYHQVHPHDLFDRDLVHTMLARDSNNNSIVVGAGKGGVVVGLDPKSGKLRWSTEVGEHHNDDRTELAGPTTVTPGTFGGVLTPPAHADGFAYFAVVNAANELRPDAPSYIGAELGQSPGRVEAIDLSTGKVAWRTSVFGDPLGGVTVVNNLVLTTLLDGTLVVMDRADGHQVLQVKLIGGTNGWMSVADDLIVVPVGNAESPRLVAYGR